ncbi:MAG: glycosyltransferase [Bacteroidota bacterium]
MHVGVLCSPGSFHTHKWCHGLKRAGAQVTLFSLEQGTCPGIETVYVPPRFSRKGQPSYLSYLFSGDRLLKVLQEYQVDVLNPINITPFGVWADRSGFRPLVSVAMGADILEYPLNYGDRPLHNWEETAPPGKFSQLIAPLKWRIFRTLVSHSLSESSYITGDNLVLVDAIKDWFQIPPNKIHLNRWGVEPSLFHPSKDTLQKVQSYFGIQPGQPVVLAPRGMKPIYQGEIILQSYAHLLAAGKFSHVKFLIFSAGYQISGKTLELAENLADTYPNFQYVSDQLPREWVLALWPMVNLFISAPIYDGYSNAVAEGRYAGAIPVVNDSPATQELFIDKHNGHVIAPFTPENLCKRLTHLLDNLQDEQERLRTINRQWIESNSVLEENMKRFLARCEQAAQKGGPKAP